MTEHIQDLDYRGEEHPRLTPEPSNTQFELREVGAGTPHALSSALAASYDTEFAHDIRRATFTEAEWNAALADLKAAAEIRAAGEMAFTDFAIDAADYLHRLSIALHSYPFPNIPDPEPILTRARVIDRAVGNFLDPISALGEFVSSPQSAG